MDIAAGSPLQPQDSGAPQPPSGRVDWTPRDVLFGVFWFIGLFVAGQIAILPPAIIWGVKSGQLYVAAFAIGTVVELALVFVAAHFTFQRYGGSWERLGVRMPARSTLLWAVAAFFGALAVSTVYTVIINVFNLDFLKTDCAEQIPKKVRDERALLAFASFTVVAVAPFCEELFFRGFLFTGLSRRWGVAAGVIVSGSLFGAAHLLPQSFVPIAGVGMVFAYCYYRSRNILSTMLAHVGFNSLSIAAIAAGSCDSGSISNMLLRRFEL